MPLCAVLSRSGPSRGGFQLSGLCKQGPASMRPRRALAAALAMQLRASGAEVDLERTVVELAKTDAQGRVTEAILDL